MEKKFGFYKKMLMFFFADYFSIRKFQMGKKVVKQTYRSPGLSCAAHFEHVKHFKWYTRCWGWFVCCWLPDDCTFITNSLGGMFWLHAEHIGCGNILLQRKKEEKRNIVKISIILVEIYIEKSRGHVTAKLHIFKIW